MKPLTIRRVLRVIWNERQRTIAAVMLPVFFFSLLPHSAWAQVAAPGDKGNPPAEPTSQKVHVNKSAPKVPRYNGVSLPAKPSDGDITYSHAFREPLVPVGGTTSPSENQALSAAIKAHLKRKDKDDVSAIDGFLASYPDSAWRPSLDLNMAEDLFTTGNFSSALDAWSDAWNRTKLLTDATGTKTANLAVAKLAEMKARIGRTDELVALFKQIKGRNISGSAAQLLVQARSGLWLMQNKPQDAFRCGPSALQELSLATNHRVQHPELIKASRSTPQGIALPDVQALSSKIGMPMQMAKRTTGSDFITPAVIHWKLGHYAALVKKEGNKYVVHDTTFGTSYFAVTASALEKEASGYFLVPAGASLPRGWSAVTKEEGSKVMGRGNPGLDDPDAFLAIDADSGGDCGKGFIWADDCCGNGAWPVDPPYDPMLDPNADHMGDPLPDPDAGDRGDSDSSGSFEAMTVPSVKAMLVSLTLRDTPVHYTPPLGPTMHFTVHYHQREITQPTTFTYANLGPNWTFTYLSYVTPGYDTASVYVRGGGVENYIYDATIGGYDPNQQSQATLAQLDDTTWTRTLPTGEVETFGEPDGAGNFFLTKITDPLGSSLTLAYNSHLRLTSFTDALGQVTTLTYGSDTFGNASYYNITEVTDPFGRSALFSYDGNGRLQEITDITGITSQFAYLEDSTFVKTLTTPYGATQFTFGDNTTDPSLGSTRWVNTTYPDGNSSRTEFNQTVALADTDPIGIPSGMYGGGGQNSYMEYRNTFYWDKQGMRCHPGDYTHAQIIHWLHTSDINTCSDIEESVKDVDENRVWFAYAGELSSIQAGPTMIAQPTQRGRILDDGSTQLYQYQYNAIGKVTQKIDPAGRETDYTYAPNNIDLVTVQQNNGAGYDQLSTITYNSKHEILTKTDATGQTTHYSYNNTNGQLVSVTNPKGETTTYTHDGNGYLTKVTGPASGSSVSYTYDSYGRVSTRTDSQGYTTTMDYDAMDRPIRTTYPDSSTSVTAYLYLDPEYSIDRLGRVTRYFYNSVRQETSVRDSQGNVTSMTWSPSGHIATITDPNLQTTTWKYDEHDRLIEKDYPGGSTQQLAYETTTSRLQSVTDNKGQIATTTYNVDNSVAQIAYTNTDATTPTETYSYDPVYLRVSSMTDGTGTTTYSYNPVTTNAGSHLLASMHTPLATIAYTYDKLGRPIGRSVDGVSSSYGYDSLGRVTTVTNALSASPFVYTFLGNTRRIATITDPNGQSTVFTYEDSSTTPNEPRLSEITNLNASSAVVSKFDYAFDADSHMTTWTQQTDSNHPQKASAQYDLAGRLAGASVTDTVSGSVLHQYAYLYDGVGNRTSEQIDGNVTAAGYNNRNQMTSQTAGGKMVFSGSTGSVPSMVTVGGNAATANYSTNFTGIANVTNGTNVVAVVAHDVNSNYSTNSYQVVIPSSSGSFTYDLNGNLTGDGTHSYTWDGKNQLVSIAYNSGTNSGNHTEFTYNGLGQRVAIVERSGTTYGDGTITSTKQYVWSKGGAILEERDGSNSVTKRYFKEGLQTIASGVSTNYFYTTDQLGSIREVLASDGTTIKARYSYDPFGRATAVSGPLVSDFQYAGMFTHAISGMNLTQYRFYNASLGRWISRDPSGEASGLNLYAYCGNSPLDQTDSLGLCADDGGLGIGLLYTAGAAIGKAALEGAAKADALVAQLDSALALAEAEGNEELVTELLKQIRDALEDLDSDDPAAYVQILDHLQTVLNNHHVPINLPLLNPNINPKDAIKHIFHDVLDL